MYTACNSGFNGGWVRTTWVQVRMVSLIANMASYLLSEIKGLHLSLIVPEFPLCESALLTEIYCFLFLCLEELWRRVTKELSLSRGPEASRILCNMRQWQISELHWQARVAHINFIGISWSPNSPPFKSKSALRPGWMDHARQVAVRTWSLPATFPNFHVGRNRTSKDLTTQSPTRNTNSRKTPSRRVDG